MPVSRRLPGALALALVAALLAGPAHAESVRASWYASGHRTANGERFDPNGLTVAHRSLRFGTRLHLEHGRRRVVVRVNDRGPFIAGRTLDLARGSARALGCEAAGVCTVRIARVEPPR